MLPSLFIDMKRAQRRDGTWKHDKFDEVSKKQAPKPRSEPKPPMTEEERGYKVTVSNTAFTEEEFKVRVQKNAISLL
jgi:HSP20 family molecular chaperone IbpA